MRDSPASQRGRSQGAALERPSVRDGFDRAWSSNPSRCRSRSMCWAIVLAAALVRLPLILVARVLVAPALLVMPVAIEQRHAPRRLPTYGVLRPAHTSPSRDVQGHRCGAACQLNGRRAVTVARPRPAAGTAHAGTFSVVRARPSNEECVARPRPIASWPGATLPEPSPRRRATSAARDREVRRGDSPSAHVR